MTVAPLIFSFFITSSGALPFSGFFLHKVFSHYAILAYGYQTLEAECSTDSVVRIVPREVVVIHAEQVPNSDQL